MLSKVGDNLHLVKTADELLLLRKCAKGPSGTQQSEVNSARVFAYSTQLFHDPIQCRFAVENCSKKFTDSFRQDSKLSL